MRIALLTLEALANARAVRRFVAAHAQDIALVGLSDPYRPEAGGVFGQTMRRVRQSGPAILPYLTMNFTLPGILGAIPKAGDVDRTPLARACKAHGIEAVTVRDVNGAEFLGRLRESGAELILSFHFDQILKAEAIATTPRGGINVHAGLLPLHRGPVPTIHALLDDPVRLGVTIHRLVPQIDAGAALAQVEIADEPGLTAIGAAARLHEAALPLLDDLLPRIAAGTETETALPTLPYRPFPTADELARLRRKGRRLTSPSDLRSVWG